MKCLSVRNPWAGAIVLGRKTVEYRTWKTNYRGTLLIHAGKKLETFEIWHNHPVHTVTGCIIGCVDIVDCVDCVHPKYGGWRWMLDNPSPFFTPIPYKGRVGLFNVPDAILPQLERLGTVP